MYALSRLLLMIAVLCGCYFLAIMVATTWPLSGLMLLVGVAAHFTRKGYGYLTTLGAAHWADVRDLRRAGMLGGESGLILGRVAAKGRNWPNDGVPGVFARQLNAKAACRQFWSGRRGGPLVRLPQAVHTAVFAPSGAGKGVSCVVPFLLDCPDSAVVLDFKGENARLTARHRAQAFAHRVVLVDPYKLVTQRPDTFNPLDFIDAESEQAIDECHGLGKALVVRNPEEREPHWSDSAEAWITATLALTVQYGERGETRSLQTVRELLTDPEKVDMAVKGMRESTCWNGMLARMGGHLAHFIEKEKSSTLTSVARHLRFLDTLAVAESTRTSSFNAADLRRGNMTMYLILPPEHMRAQSGLLRVWIGSMLRAVVKGGLQEHRKVHFILDEAASIGQLDAIDDAVDKYRGYGVRLMFIFQSLGQLKQCFPEGRDQTLLSNTSQLFFGVNDNQTAEYVSGHMGESTIRVNSGGTSSGNSTSWSEGTHPQSGGGGSYNSSRNWQEQARKLLTPGEVMTLPARTAITFVSGMPPIRTTLIRFYNERKLFRRTGRFGRSLAAWFTLASSATLCAAALGAAALATLMVLDSLGYSLPILY